MIFICCLQSALRYLIYKNLKNYYTKEINIREEFLSQHSGIKNLISQKKSECCWVSCIEIILWPTCHFICGHDVDWRFCREKMSIDVSMVVWTHRKPATHYSSLFVNNDKTTFLRRNLNFAKRGENASTDYLPLGFKPIPECANLDSRVSDQGKICDTY